MGDETIRVPDDGVVLFVCRHGAAKSVLAAAELRRLAAERGIVIAAGSAGIEPDREVAAAVIPYLGPGTAGDDTPRPRRVRSSDILSAWRVITFDLDPSEIPRGARHIERWDGLPAAGEDPAGALAALGRRISQLLDECA